CCDRPCISKTLPLLCGVIVWLLTASGFAAEVISWHGYGRAIELRNGTVRVVLCPEVGGRVLEYSLNGENVLYVSEEEKQWRPGQKPASSAGRFDIGPELVIPRRPILWSGEWKGEVTGIRSARLTSPQDPETGVQLVRDFTLDAEGTHLECRQTIVNVSDSMKEWCHWSRTFAVGRGICLIPLSDPQSGPKSRFPNGWVMYEEGSLINMKPEDPKIQRRGNVLEIRPVPRKPKMGFDSYAGQIIYLAPNNLLFFKRFATWPDRVYNEAAGLTISVWYPDNQMIELEPIGPRERLQPGESASFSEHWYLTPHEFPGSESEIDVKAVLSIADRLQE
ncbi:MAG: hypothetical protein KDA89_05715, partial [Planctomycetaceae bacterium]|nr:hypothetical protein [Planctomycetaceae bacterium]